MQGVDAEIRANLDAELLSRPPLDIVFPAKAWHQAFLNGHNNSNHDLIKPVFEDLGFDLPAPEERQTVRKCSQGFIKWEKHGEFETITVIANEQENAAQWADNINKQIQKSGHGRRIAACCINILPIMHMVKTGGAPRASAGSKLIGNNGVVFAHYPPDGNGFTQLVLYLEPILSDRAGRLIQRLLEIETYRYMALLGFPEARHVQKKIIKLNQRLGSYIAGLDNALDQKRSEELLEDIQSLIQSAAKLRARTSFRFGATRAYYNIFQKRLLELREERLENFSRLSTFLGRRMQPALTFCEAMEQQQNTLDERLSQASQVLRTRVELGLAKQNKEQLARLKDSMEIQIKLQRSVEGFSVVAISYYVVSLIAIFLKGGEKAGWFFGWEIYEALLAPVAILIVMLRLRHVLKSHAHTPPSST